MKKIVLVHLFQIHITFIRKLQNIFVLSHRYKMRYSFLYSLVLWISFSPLVQGQDFWQQTGFPSSSDVYSILCKKDTVFGTTSSGIYASSDNGTTFIKLTPGEESIKKLSSTLDGCLLGVTAISNHVRGIARSTTNGISWEYPPPYGPTYLFEPYSIYTEGNFAVCGGCEFDGVGSLYATINSGYSWYRTLTVHTSQNITHKIISVLIFNGIAIGCIEHAQNINPPFPQYIYFYEIFNNAGPVWEFTSSIQAREFAYNSLNQVFAATTLGVFRSDDSGHAWQQVSVLPTNDLRCIVVDPNDDIYIGTGNKGIFISSDNGYTWNPLNGGITDTVINTIAVSQEGYLFAGTKHAGIFRSIQPVISVGINRDLPNNYELYQNYPNPFNPLTTISFLVPKAQIVELKIFDILGNDIKTLLNGFIEAGEHEILFDGSLLSSGIYFYQLKSKDFLQTKKFVLLR